MKVYENAPVIGIRCAQIDPTVELKIRRDLKKITSAILVSAVFASGSVWVLSDQGWETASLEAWLGLILFGGAAIGYTIFALLGRRDPLVLSPRGLCDYRISNTVVPWSEVTGVNQSTLGRFNRVVAVTVKKEAMANFKAHLFGRRLSRISAKMGLKTIYIQGDLEPSIEELVEIISQYARNYNPDFESSES